MTLLWIKLHYVGICVTIKIVVLMLQVIAQKSTEVRCSVKYFTAMTTINKLTVAKLLPAVKASLPTGTAQYQTRPNKNKHCSASELDL